jgi:UDP-sulfoquinovose synthase
MFRRDWVEEMGSWSATPICSMQERLEAFRDRYKTPLQFWQGDLRDYSFVANIFREFKPDSIVHFGECPSAPYSMIDVNHSVFVQTNNITTTFNLLYAMRDICPQAHLVKLGTMGEYGTPDVDIPEGFFEIEFRGRRARLPFPRLAGSWYHWSKVHGSNNIMLIWKTRATNRKTTTTRRITSYCSTLATSRLTLSRTKSRSCSKTCFLFANAS